MKVCIMWPFSVYFQIKVEFCKPKLLSCGFTCQLITVLTTLLWTAWTIPSIGKSRRVWHTTAFEPWSKLWGEGEGEGGSRWLAGRRRKRSWGNQRWKMHSSLTQDCYLSWMFSNSDFVNLEPGQVGRATSQIFPRWWKDLGCGILDRCRWFVNGTALLFCKLWGWQISASLHLETMSRRYYSFNSQIISKQN